MASSSSSAGGSVLESEWMNVLHHIQHQIPEHLSGWTTLPKKEEYYGPAQKYDAFIRPNHFVTLTQISNKLKKHQFNSNTEVLDLLHMMFENAFRFWYDPTPIPTAATGADAKSRKQEKGVEPRKGIIELLAQVHDYIASRHALVQALAGEGVAFAPWYRSFAGAAFVASELEKWYMANYGEAYWFYYRDGVYHPEAEPGEEPFSEPEDYTQFVSNPVYLHNVFERLYCSKYSDINGVAQDMRTMFSNAKTYYGDDAEFGTGKYCGSLSKTFEDWWSKISPKAAETDPQAYIPHVPAPPSSSPTASAASAAPKAIITPPSPGTEQLMQAQAAVAHATAQVTASAAADNGPAQQAAVQAQATAQMTLLGLLIQRSSAGKPIDLTTLTPANFTSWAHTLHAYVVQIAAQQGQAQAAAAAAGGASAAPEGGAEGGEAAPAPAS